jgi:ribosomal protein S18 acetylase RimI-like enzyme
MTGAPVIRPVGPDDYDAWLPLWAANNQGHVAKNVTKTTWERLTDPAGQIHGLGAWVDGALAGFVHAVIHPVTGHTRPACYMQDLYVDPAFRQRGIGRALVLALTDEAKHRRYARLYWLAEAGNEAAQALYASLGVRLDFTFHVMPL